MAQSLVVEPGNEYRRLDQFVAAAVAPEHSRSQVSRMIKAGLITVNGMAVRTSCAVHTGDRIDIASPAHREPAPSLSTDAARILADSLEVLFSDEELLAVNKPAGVPVHPAPGHPHSTLADALLIRFPDLALMREPDGVMRAGIVHRLDKETSGVMVIARTPFARMRLSEQFKDRVVSKVYLSIVTGLVAQDRFTVDRSLGRHPTDRKRMSIRSHRSRDARTDFQVLRRFEDSLKPVTLLKARPRTGRTHQIRVHLAASGHPCIGDSSYGGKPDARWVRGGQALHALALRISHPREGNPMEFVAPLADDFNRFLQAVGLMVCPAMIRHWIDAV